MLHTRVESLPDRLGLNPLHQLGRRRALGVGVGLAVGPDKSRIGVMSRVVGYAKAHEDRPRRVGEPAARAFVRLDGQVRIGRRGCARRAGRG